MWPSGVLSTKLLGARCPEKPGVVVCVELTMCGYVLIWMLLLWAIQAIFALSLSSIRARGWTVRHTGNNAVYHFVCIVYMRHG